MFLIPITHERNKSRRLPIVTISIIATCLLTLSWSQWTERQIVRRLNDDLVQAVTLYKTNRAKLQAPAMLKQIAVNGYVRNPSEFPTLDDDLPPSRDDIEDPALRAQQSRLDELLRKVVRTYEDAPTVKLGLIPARSRWWTYVTHMFMHAGWFHLGFNAWFFWLVGCNLEDRWGRLIYSGFYLASGLVAAVTYVSFFPDSTVPLVGASGAIAGSMGAFAVLMGGVRVRFLFWFIKSFYFHLRAYLALSLWFLLNLLDAVMAGPHNRVAYWAHVGGFAFGVVVALAMKFSGLDKRLDESIEYEGGTRQDPRLIEAGDLLTRHEMAAGMKLLRELAAEQPSNVDVFLELLRGAKMSGDASSQVEVYERIIDLYLRSGDIDSAAHTWSDLTAEHLEQQMRRDAMMRFAKRFAGAGKYELATRVFANCHESGGIVDSLAVEALIGRARAEAALGNGQQAMELLDAARQSPFSTVELDEIANNLIERLRRNKAR